jgi:hypothetical protein
MIANVKKCVFRCCDDLQFNNTNIMSLLYVIQIVLSLQCKM